MNGGARDRHSLIRQQLRTLAMLPPGLNELLASAVHPEPSQRCTARQLQKGLIDFAPSSGAASSSAPAFDVRAWLAGLQPSMALYADAFVENAIETEEVLRALSDADLRELGVGLLGHRRQLALAISQL